MTHVVRRGWKAARLAVAVMISFGFGLAACGGATTDSSSSTVSAEFQAGLMSRWNAVAKGIKTSQGLDFDWKTFDQFPHPTFKGGDADAYERFAEILVAFYEAGDNFDYLAKNHLLDATLRYVAPPSQISSPSGRPMMEMSFKEVTGDLARNSPLPIAADTLAKLREFDARIDVETGSAAH